MKTRFFLLLSLVCLSQMAFAQKAPKKAFATVTPAKTIINWQQGEQISLFDDDTQQGAVYVSTQTGEKTYFAGKGACRTEEGNWLAVYPSSSLRKWNSTTVHFVIPREQVVNMPGNPFYSKTQTNEVDFQPLTAYLKFDLPAGMPPIKEISFTSSKIISGNYKANLDARNVSVQLDEGERYREIVLKPEDGGVFKPGQYKMAIFARTLPEGLLVKLVAEDGRVALKKISAELKFSLGRTRDLGIMHNLQFAHPNASSDAVGTAYGNEGVIFWVDPENPGDPFKAKVVAASADVMKWAASNDKYGIHSHKENYVQAHEKVTTLQSYKDNPKKYPAINACDQMRKAYGGNWHVPSLTEMKYLFNAYYGKQDCVLPENGTEYTDQESLAAAARFDASLEALGGEKMFARSNKYWLCGQNSDGNMQYVDMKKFHNGNNPQTNEYYVRCVRDVETRKIYTSKSYPQTEVGKILKSDLCDKVVDVLWDTTYTIAPGLEFYQLTVVTDVYEKHNLYLMRTDTSKGLDFKVAISDQTKGSTWKRQTLSKMFAHVDTPTNPVYAMINADFCDNREPIRPRGPVHSEGKIWFPKYSLDPRFDQQALSYVGVTFEGKMTIGPNVDYPVVQKNLRECTGAGVILMKDYQIQTMFLDCLDREPRTAIGYTSDNIVWVFAVDGRHNLVGMSYAEMASIFKGLGCMDAVNLDGGGSTQMFVRNPQSGQFGLCNWPTDPHNGFGGRERPRLNAWTIVKK